MANYTYEQFQSALGASGLAGGFSASDLELAKRNPDAGMTLLNYKRDYLSASTDEAKALANAGAESTRKSFGGYTGGADGSGFYLPEPSPSSFQAGSSPVYSSSYQGKIDSLLGERETRGSFSYDAASDPSYSAYKKQYTREGQRATADTLGSVAAMTGGKPSSYAVSAAAQAGNYYAGKLADKAPELEQQAYGRWQDEQSRKDGDLAAYLDAENAAYGRYKDQLSQFNIDRNVNYAQFLDELTHQQNKEQTAYDRDQDVYSRKTSEEQAVYNRQLNEAKLAAEFGDFGKLEALGVDVSAYRAQMERERADSEYEKEYNKALLAAQYGDYSGLRALGVDTSAYEAAQSAAASGSGSSRSSGTAAKKSLTSAERTTLKSAAETMMKLDQWDDPRVAQYCEEVLNVSVAEYIAAQLNSGEQMSDAAVEYLRSQGWNVDEGQADGVTGMDGALPAPEGAGGTEDSSSGYGKLTDVLPAPTAKRTGVEVTDNGNRVSTGPAIKAQRYQGSADVTDRYKNSGVSNPVRETGSGGQQIYVSGAGWIDINEIIKDNGRRYAAAHDAATDRYYYYLRSAGQSGGTEG